MLLANVHVHVRYILSSVRLSYITLTFHHHISALIAKSARSFYALKTIRAHGLNGNALWDVTRATLVSQLLYASPAWWGYLKADERNRLQAVIKKAIRISPDPSALWTN